MQIIRRLYLYLIAFISLEVVLWGSIGLMRSLLAGEQIGSLASRLAGALSLTLVGAPVFLIHWLPAQKSAATSIDERSSRLRAWFLFVALAATLVPVVQNSLAFLSRGFVVSFSLPATNALIGGEQSLVDNLAAIVLNCLAAAYLFSIQRSDCQVLSTTDAADNTELEVSQAFSETRRLYRYFWLLYSIVMLSAAVYQLVGFLIGSVASIGGGVIVQLANGLGLLALGLPLWLWTGRVLRISLVDSDESRSTLRRVLLHILSLGSLLGLLTAGAVILEVLLRLLLGDAMSVVELMDHLRAPFSLAVPLLGVWVYYRHMLQGEIASLPDEHERQKLLRIKGYILTLAGLATTIYGVNMLLGFLLDLLLKENTLWGDPMRQTLTTALTLLLVGVPLWVLNWRGLQMGALTHNEAGDESRCSLVRRSYLYLALFAGVMGVMFGSGMLLYHWISAWLGNPPDNLLVQSSQSIKLVVLFALLLIYHQRVLHEDTLRIRQELEMQQARFPVLVWAPGDPPWVATLLAALQREAPAIPVTLHRSDAIPADEVLNRSRAIILFGDLLLQVEPAARQFLSSFQGERLVVPQPAKGWHWIGSEGLAQQHLVRRTAHLVRQCAEGKPPTRELTASSWIMAVYVLAALFALQLLVSLASIAISFIAD